MSERGTAEAGSRALPTHHLQGFAASRSFVDRHTVLREIGVRESTILNLLGPEFHARYGRPSRIPSYLNVPAVT